MIQMSESYREAIRTGQRGSWDARLYVGGVEYPKENIVSLKLYEQEFASEKVGIGSVIVSRVELKLRNIRAQLSNKQITFKIGMMVGGAYEYVQFGDFYVTEVQGTQEQEVLDVTAYDVLKRSEKEYKTSLTYPASLQAVTNEIMQLCGLTLAPTSFPAITLDTPISADTCRKALGVIAQLMGANVVANRRSQVEFRWLNHTDLILYPHQYYSWIKADRWNYLKGIRCKTYDGECGVDFTYGDDFDPAGGDATYINFSNPYGTQDIVHQIAERMTTTAVWRPGPCEFIGDPSICVGDIIRIKDKKGELHQYPIMENIMEYDGGVKNSINCYAETEEAQELSTQQKSTDEKISDAVNNTVPGKVDDYLSSDAVSNVIDNKVSDYFNNGAGKQQLQDMIMDLLRVATSTRLGGIYADPKKDTDTIPVRIGEDGKLYVGTGEDAEPNMWFNRSVYYAGLGENDGRYRDENGNYKPGESSWIDQIHLEYADGVEFPKTINFTSSNNSVYVENYEYDDTRPSFSLDWVEFEDYKEQGVRKTTADITAKSDNGYEAKCKVVVLLDWFSFEVEFLDPNKLAAYDVMTNGACAIKTSDSSFGEMNSIQEVLYVGSYGTNPLEVTVYGLFQYMNNLHSNAVYVKLTSPLPYWAFIPDARSYTAIPFSLNQFDEIVEDIFLDNLIDARSNGEFHALEGTYLFSDGYLRKIPDKLVEWVQEGYITSNFKGMFYDCVNLTGEAPRLWEIFPDADGTGCFHGCTGLTNYNDIPDNWRNKIKEQEE